MKKKFFVSMLLCLGILGNYHAAFAMEKADVELYYLGRNTMLDNPIYVENDTYFVPLRECAEQIGYEVRYTPSVITLKYLYDIGQETKYDIENHKIFRYDREIGECDIKNINGLSYISINDFYGTSFGKNIYNIEHDGKKIIQIQLSGKPYQKSDFESSLELLNVIEKNQNGVISPISMKLSLAMVANGTTGQTQKEILNVLGYDTIEQCNDFVSNEVLKWKVEERRSDYKYLNENEGGIHFANSLWYNSGDKKTEKNIFNENFVNCTHSIFGAVSGIVTNDTAVPTINEWIEQQTNGMIKNMISDANFQTALVNTIYFKCCWKDEFKNENTKKGVFYNIDNTQSETDFMNAIRDNQIYYCESFGWQMLGLTYSDEKYTMYLFLPEKGKELQIDDKTINALMKFQESVKVDISMPKFSTEDMYDFTDTLKEMGIKGMFENNEDFSNMYVDNNAMHITDVLQKTKIVVNEQGTEASSGAMMATRGADMTKPVKFQADRPFIYMITKNTNGKQEVLFVGQYVTAKQ